VTADRGPALGVGLTFHPQLERFVEEHSALIDVLELEPQTLWLPAAAAGASFGVAAGAMDRLAELPQRKLVHSVGTPVGGSRLGDPRQLPLLREAIARLDAPWCSEHLSFNVAGGQGGSFFTSFMLPPRQTVEGVARAAASVGALSELLGAPLAIETGVSYLRPRDDELRDGEFVAAVAEASGCAILLDVHNIWTNELNGRQSILSYLDDLPLDRVWELHLAGGQEHAGFWLDAHSGAIPDEVLRVARDVLAATPNVGAMIFELMPEQVASLGDDGLRRQLEAMRELWEGRPSPGRDREPAAARPLELRAAAHGDDREGRPSTGRDREPAAARSLELRGAAHGDDVEAWEDALGALAIGLEPEGDLGAELATDPGVGVVQTMVESARAGSLVTSLRLSMRLLLIHEGEQGTRDLMRAFWDTAPPQPFAGDEGLAFAAWLSGAAIDLPFLDDVLAFELALLRASISGETTTVRFAADPAVLLGALAEGRMPEEVAAGDYAFEVSPQAVQ
jgi:uncharacterized protein (UPF0276 family)